jgi:L-ascorbate metabolism protein UlaG (beta-lactamase superfamily)
MKIHHLRNATIVLEAGGKRILVDPMLGSKGSLPPLAFIRHKARRNPTVELPGSSEQVLAELHAALITHCRYGHADHFDKAGNALLKDRNLPVYCHSKDVRFLQKKGLRTEPIAPHQPRDFFDGQITAFHAVHGYGLVGKMMGPGVGYLIELPGEPTIYLSGDTVLTDEVKRVLTEHKPDIAVVHAGSASLDFGRPILMPMNELLAFMRLAPGRVVANHMEAVNHCPTTRVQLHEEAQRAGLDDKLITPEDGQTVELSR